MANHPPYWYWENQLTLKEIKKLNKLIMSNYDFVEPQNIQPIIQTELLKKI